MKNLRKFFKPIVNAKSIIFRHLSEKGSDKELPVLMTGVEY